MDNGPVYHISSRESQKSAAFYKVISTSSGEGQNYLKFRDCRSFLYRHEGLILFISCCILHSMFLNLESCFILNWSYKFCAKELYLVLWIVVDNQWFLSYFQSVWFLTQSVNLLIVITIFCFFPNYANVYLLLHRF